MPGNTKPPTGIPEMTKIDYNQSVVQPLAKWLCVWRKWVAEPAVNLITPKVLGQKKKKKEERKKFDHVN